MAVGWTTEGPHKWLICTKSCKSLLVKLAWTQVIMTWLQPKCYSDRVKGTNIQCTVKTEIMWGRCTWFNEWETLQNFTQKKKKKKPKGGQVTKTCVFVCGTFQKWQLTQPKIDSMCVRANQRTPVSQLLLPGHNGLFYRPFYVTDGSSFWLFHAQTQPLWTPSLAIRTPCVPFEGEHGTC